MQMRAESQYLHIIQGKVINLSWNNQLNQEENIACFDLQQGAKVVALEGWKNERKCSLQFIYK